MNKKNISTDFYGLGSETSLTIPRGRDNLPPLIFDMTEIYRILARTSEIERVTPATYGQLVTEFNMGMIQLNRLVALVEIELQEAKNALDIVEATILLERVDGYLNQKGIKSSADTRKAAIILDQEYQAALHKRDALRAISEYVKGLKESLERAYFSAKQVAEFTSYDPYLPKTAGEALNE